MGGLNSPFFLSYIYMFKNIPNKCYETEDGLKWMSRSVAVTVAVIGNIGKKSYLLLTKRSEAMEEPGRWCLPGGYLDYNETLQEAVDREVYEETGIILSDFKEDQVISINEIYIDSTPKTIRQNVVIFYLRCYAFDEKLPEWSLTSEVSEIEWVEMGTDEIFKRNLAFGQYEVLQKVSILKNKDDEMSIEEMLSYGH